MPPLHRLAALAILLPGALAAAPAPVPPAVRAWVAAHHPDDAGATLQVAQADLNHDGRADALVYVAGPGQCGSGGCDLLILAASAQGYRQVGSVSIVQLPVRLLPTRHHGWQDIGVRVAGGGILPGYDAALHFDGRRYPGNPSVAPAVRLARAAGRIVIAPAALLRSQLAPAPPPALP